MIIINIKPYWQYLKYVIEHKKNVFMECWKEGLYWQAIIHDLSKFLPSEFIPYARYFYIDKEKYKNDFKKACELHYKRNKHHWNCWWEQKKDMLPEYVKEMIADWWTMGRKFGNTPQEFYLKNYNNIHLTKQTRLMVEQYLGLNKFAEYEVFCWMTIDEIIKTCLRYEKEFPNRFNKEWFYDKYLNDFKRKYNVDMLEILGHKVE